MRAMPYSARRMSRVLGVVGAGTEAVRVMNTSLVWGRSFPVSRIIYLFVVGQCEYPKLAGSGPAALG
jgi:hypothetical protein